MTLPPRSLGVRMHCRIRRFIRRSRPVRLGQTPVGLVLAAAMILLWGLQRPAAAAVVTGSSENEYFTLSWLYDLDNGIGTFALWAKQEAGTDGLSLGGGSFTMRGVVADCTVGGSLNFSGSPLDIGMDKGQRVYQYDLAGTFSPLLGGFPVCSGTLSFPTKNVELVPGKLTLAGDFFGLSGIASAIGSGIASSIVRPYGPVDMDFVTVQAIPKPGDINGDGSVDVTDLLLLVDSFGASAGDASYSAACDFNKDGSVDVIDLLTMIENWDR